MPLHWVWAFDLMMQWFLIFGDVEALWKFYKSLKPTSLKLKSCFL